MKTIIPKKILLIGALLVWVLFSAIVSFGGNLFVGDNGSASVREFNAKDGNFIGVVATSPAYNAVNGVAFHPETNRLFSSDQINADVRTTDVVSKQAFGTFGQTGTGTFLQSPRGIAFHPTTNNLFVADPGNADVREFDGNTGNFVNSFGQTAGNVGSPLDIAFHPTTGNLFVADQGNGDIREFDGTSGNFLGVFGQTAGALQAPFALDFNPNNGNLIVADQGGNNDVRQFDGTSGTLIGSGGFGQTGANLTTPAGMAFHPTRGTLFVSDVGAGDIKAFDGSSGSFQGSFGDTATNLTGPLHFAFDPSVPSRFIVAAPYWQSDTASYTFMAISHPALSLMNSQIGLKILAQLDDGSGSFGQTEVILNAGETKKVFIIRSGHPTIDANTQPGSGFIIGTTSSKNGNVLFLPSANNPDSLGGLPSSAGRGYRDITMLNYWGAIVIESTITGFAMEFIGDNHDSIAFNTPYFSGIN